MACLMSDAFQTKVVDGVLLISVNLPRLDASSSSSLKKQLDFPMEPSVTKADVDLASVQFIDSSGVGVLLSIYRKLPQSSAEVILRNVQSGVQSVLELLRLHRVFQVQ
jgi:anti-sigma B factor antagonist